jgi:predicted dehydrogenase
MEFDEDERDDTPVRWGIIGPGLIARNAILPAFDTLPSTNVIAVASRDELRAQTFANDFGIPRVYTAYQDLIDDPDIEAVYIALPNNLHPVWAIRAMQAGKHVLCEKPLATTAAEAQRMVDASDEADVWLMEAVMYRFHPRMRELGELVRSGVIGVPTLLRASFCFTLSAPDNYRNDPALGGGALLDVGSYTVNAARWLFDEEPVTALALGVLAESGTDASVSGVLSFPSGALAQVQCSFASAEHQSLDLIGTLGTIDVAIPFTAYRNDETALILTVMNQREETFFPATDPYALMLEHFGDCVRGDSDPLLPADDGVGTLRVLDALRRSLSSGRAERVG